MLFDGLSISVILGVFGIFVLVLLKKQKTRSNLFFLLFVFVVFLWLLFNYLLKITEDPIYVLALLRLTFSIGALAVFLLLAFSLEFPKRLQARTDTIELVILFPTLALMAVSFSSLIVESYVKQDSIISPSYGPAFFLFNIFFFAYFLATLFFLVRKLKIFFGILRQQVKFLFLGIGLFFLFVMIADLFVPLFVDSNFLANFSYLSVVILIVFAAFAIFKHHLFDIKVVATELLAGGIIFVLLVDAFLSKSREEIIFHFLFALGVIILSVMLVKSVVKEVNQRQQIWEMAEDLEEANQYLKRLDETKTNFINIAAHQLKTPISGIKGYLSMLAEEDYGKLSPPQKKVSKKILENIDRLIRLVNIFLDVSRIEAGKMRLLKEEIGLESLVMATVEILMPQIKEKKLEIKLDFEKNLPKVFADPEKIRNVVLNLVDNAIKYTPKGTISIFAKRKGSEVLIGVKDFGIGIETHEISRLFQKFERAKNGMEFAPQGAGLGLFVVKFIVEAHGGKVWAESRGLNMGTTFYFSLPIK